MAMIVICLHCSHVTEAVIVRLQSQTNSCVHNLQCRPELNHPKYTRNTLQEILVHCVRPEASMCLS